MHTNIVLQPTYTYEGRRVIGAGECAEIDCACGFHTHGWVYESYKGGLRVECDGCGETFPAALPQ